MNREDILHMAGEAGFSYRHREVYFDQQLEHFAKLVAEAEREACAKLIEDDSRLYGWRSFAEAIRARGNE